jgi:two-component sensor histidine kinase
MSESSEFGRAAPRATPFPVEALEAALERERERSREIDHRARNSLQLAGSLVQLMARRAPTPEAQRALRSLQRRVGAIAAVHRGFSDSPRPNRFDLTSFLRDQMANLARGAPPGANLRLDLESVEIDSAAAAPLGLIACELVANALAHAGPEPKVAVGLKRLDDGWRLSVEDDGPGLPPSGENPGLGLTIVRLMAQQLGADLFFEDAHPGLRAVVASA